MSDLISRQTAIDALCDNCDHVKAVCPHYPCKQFLAFENLPPAESGSYMISMIELPDIERLKEIVNNPSYMTIFPSPKAQPEPCKYWDAESKYCALNRPSAQPERKKGMWIKHEDRSCWYCSDCHADNYYAYSWNNNTGEYEFQDKFCPNCGAEMTGGDE